jgi:hypothetical protein
MGNLCVVKLTWVGVIEYRLRARKKGQMKRVKQPKYCVKTRTDVEIMDDNFKWRKYGQKAVKNSPYPR